MPPWSGARAAQAMRDIARLRGDGLAEGGARPPLQGDGWPPGAGGIPQRQRGPGAPAQRGTGPRRPQASWIEPHPEVF